MIRNCLVLAIGLLLAACSASTPVDLTAHYVREGSDPVTIHAAANGDSRVEAGNRVFIRRDGVEYLVLRDAAGSYAAKLENAIAYEAERAAYKATPRVQPEYALGEGGQDNIGGFQGKLWYLHPKELPSLHSAEAVIAIDPTLEPMGKGLAMQTRYSVSVNAARLGGLGNFERAMIALFDKGPVLRFGTALRLQRLEKKPIPAESFALPVVLDRAALAARLAGAPAS
jgi:hypothetical protein